MKIACELKKIKNDQMEGLPEGEQLYLYVYLNGKDEKLVNVPFMEFQRIYENEKQTSMPLASSPTVGVGDQITSLTEYKCRPNFNRLMNFLTEQMEIKEKDFENEEELVIESSMGVLLELPWEDIANKKAVLRKVISERQNTAKEHPGNFLLVISNSNQSSNGKLADLRAKLKEEVLEIMGHIMDAIPKDFKVDNVHMSKHTTKDIFKSLNWDKFNYVHMVMHGDERGGLGLENSNADNYKVQDVISVNDVVDLLEDKNFLLLFLSFCYSGSCLAKNDSLAFQMTNKGAAKYVIGYRYGIGEKSASNFAKTFYNFLVNGHAKGQDDRIEEVYKKSLREYYQTNLENDYIPVLYINAYGSN